MDAAALLAQLRQDPDLTPLLRALGGTEGWQRLPPGVLPTDAPDGAWVLRLGSF